MYKLRITIRSVGCSGRASQLFQNATTSYFNFCKHSIDGIYKIQTNLWKSRFLCSSLNYITRNNIDSVLTADPYLKFFLIKIFVKIFSKFSCWQRIFFNSTIYSIVLCTIQHREMTFHCWEI